MNNFDDIDCEWLDELTADEIDAAMHVQRMDLGNDTGDIKESECDTDVASFFQGLSPKNYITTTEARKAYTVVSQTPFSAKFVNSNSSASIVVPPSRPYKRKTPEEQATESNQKRRKTNNDAVKRCREKQKLQRQFEAAEHERIVAELKQELHEKDAIIERQQNEIIGLMDELSAWRDAADDK